VRSRASLHVVRNDEPAPSTAYEHEQRRHIASRDWAAVHERDARLLREVRLLRRLDALGGFLAVVALLSIAGAIASLKFDAPGTALDFLLAALGGGGNLVLIGLFQSRLSGGR
jgi:hypothetical protein